jgi:tripartite-type tricarboxylate transporter receptor subunit TctC
MSVCSGSCATGSSHQQVRPCLLFRAINDGLKSAETRASIAKLGFEPKGGTPEEFGTILADEVRTWGAIAKETGVQIE